MKLFRIDFKVTHDIAGDTAYRFLCPFQICNTINLSYQQPEAGYKCSYFLFSENRNPFFQILQVRDRSIRQTCCMLLHTLLHDNAFSRLLISPVATEDAWVPPVIISRSKVPRKVPYQKAFHPHEVRDGWWKEIPDRTVYIGCNPRSTRPLWFTGPWAVNSENRERLCYVSW